MEGNKKTVLFLQDKTIALELIKQGQCSKKICEIFNCGKTQINNLLKWKHDILEDLESNNDPERRRRRHVTGNEEINELCWKWFVDAKNRSLCK